MFSPRRAIDHAIDRHLNYKIHNGIKKRAQEIEEKHRTERDAQLDANPQLTGAEVRKIYDTDLTAIQNEIKQAKQDVREQILAPLRPLIAERTQRLAKLKAQEEQRREERSRGGISHFWKKITGRNTPEPEQKSNTPQHR